MVLCGKCDAQIPEDSVFCPECGAKLITTIGRPTGNTYNVPESAAQQMVYETRSVDDPKPVCVAGKKHKIIGISAVLIVVLIAVVVIGTNILDALSYKIVADNYVEGRLAYNPYVIVGLMPDDYVDYLCAARGCTKDTLLNDVEYDLRYVVDRYDKKYGKWTYTYEIDDVEKLSVAELRDINNKLKDCGLTAKSGKEIEVEVTFNTENSGLVSETWYIIAAKIGWSWYIVEY